MLAGIRDILIISSPEAIGLYKDLLGDGQKLGIKFSYKVQPEPKGLAEAFILGKEFIGNESVALVLGDNIFYGQSFTGILRSVVENKDGATIFAYPVKDPGRFGVVDFDENLNVLSIEEKPEFPKSNYAITGLYFYDNSVVSTAQNVIPSPRGELEITDLNRMYLDRKKLKVQLLGRGFTWLDTGTQSSLLDASLYVRTIEQMQGLKIACLEEISLNHKWINENDLKSIIDDYKNTEYGQYLKGLIQ
jgi:glucose-1-phosphate thymidylyltransferase